jgi:hypothetical protein
MTFLFTYNESDNNELKHRLFWISPVAGMVLSQVASQGS